VPIPEKYINKNNKQTKFIHGSAKTHHSIQQIQCPQANRNILIFQTLNNNIFVFADDARFFLHHGVETKQSQILDWKGSFQTKSKSNKAVNE
jgi:hypothetical protein